MYELNCNVQEQSSDRQADGLVGNAGNIEYDIKVNGKPVGNNDEDVPGPEPGTGAAVCPALSLAHDRSIAASEN